MKTWEKAALIGDFLGAGIGVVLAAAVAADNVKEKAVLALQAEPERKVTAGKLVTVVIPTLREEDYLPQILTSISHQTYFPIEVVVVDGSPEESFLRTQEICQSFGATIIHRPDLNLPESRTEGAKQANGEILVFSDADNILDRYCVEYLVAALMKGYVLTHPVEGLSDDGLYAVAITFFLDWLKPNHWTTRCVAIWRDAFFAVGGYDASYDPSQGFREDLKLGQDVISHYGEESIRLVPEAVIATSARRLKATGLFGGWAVPGVRGTQVI